MTLFRRVDRNDSKDSQPCPPKAWSYQTSFLKTWNKSVETLHEELSLIWSPFGAYILLVILLSWYLRKWQFLLRKILFGLRVFFSWWLRMQGLKRISESELGVLCVFCAFGELRNQIFCYLCAVCWVFLKYQKVLALVINLFFPLFQRKCTITTILLFHEFQDITRAVFAKHDSLFQSLITSLLTFWRNINLKVLILRTRYYLQPLPPLIFLIHTPFPWVCPGFWMYI